MEQNSYSENPACREDSSLVIPSIDGLKGRGKFFCDSPDPIQNLNYKNGLKENKRRVSDRHNTERMKALEALQKSQKGDNFKQPLPVLNKQNVIVDINKSSNNPSTQLDHSDYVPFRRPNAINISDLVTDETINLESSSSCTPSNSKDSKVSFEPAEITARSTLYNKDIKNRNKLPLKGCDINDPTQTKHISVNDILASSFAPKARNLCEALESGDTTLDSSSRLMHSNSSFTSFNGSKSLPRTADMSLSKNTCTEESFNCGLSTFSFSSAGAGTNIDENEDFAPGEFMRSKLINDEISWAQEYAAIPTATLSEEAKAKVARNSVKTSSGMDSPCSINSIIGDPNFSVGNFFNMRSDRIWNILQSKSPVRCRTPVALVDEEDNTVTTTTELGVSPKISITPIIDNKTYTRIETPSISEKKAVGSLDNFTDNSYLLSISAIDRALCNLDIKSDVSDIGVSEQLLKQKRNTKSCIIPSLDVSNYNSNEKEIHERVKSFGAYVNSTNIENFNFEAEMKSENKENLNPDEINSSSNVALYDTMSFNESLLNSSDMKQLQKNLSKSRSPLSPINIDVPHIRVSQVEDGEEADNDEWPGTPIIRNKRKRRTKSPRDKSPKDKSESLNSTMQDLSDVTTPINSRSSRSYLDNNNEIIKKRSTISSTIIDKEVRNSNKNNSFDISPNNSRGHNSASSLIIRSNTLVVPHILSPRVNTSPSRLNNSPLSSPRSYSLSQLPSPTPTTLGFQSPNLDGTSNSDRRILSDGSDRNVVSSPVGSETSSTCSYRTLQTYRSATSGASARSVSRCSSSSEYSHRDGQKIPLKITNTELSWGSIKLCSESRKSMQIKNIFNKRLVIRIEVYGPGFQIVNSQRSNTLTLQSQECRTISVSFCPTVRGAAIGKLSFFAPSRTSFIAQSFLDVSLYGYGGNASVIAKNITLGPVGLPFITIGDVRELAQPLERSVSFYNKGPLLGFAAVSVDSTGLMLPRLSDAFEIYPQRILIPPQNVVNVRIIFRPKREEVRKLIKKMGNVLTLANMRIICGDEANRQRIRRLLEQMPDKERAKLSSSALDLLWSEFPQEKEIKDLQDIKENPNVAMDLASFFRIHEILLTVNHDNMDDTVEGSSLFLHDVDETVLFRTICAADSPTPSTNLETVIEQFEEVNTESWTVSPKSIEISLSTREHITLSIINGYKSRQFFEAVCNFKDILHCTPSEGYVAANGRTDIDIRLLKNLERPLENACVIVYMEHEKIEVPVKMVENN